MSHLEAPAQDRHGLLDEAWPVLIGLAMCICPLQNVRFLTVAYDEASE